MEDGSCAKILPKVLERLPTIVIFAADREGPFRLAGKLAYGAGLGLANN